MKPENKKTMMLKFWETKYNLAMKRTDYELAKQCLDEIDKLTQPPYLAKESD